MEQNLNLTNQDSSLLSYLIIYRNFVGRLIYLTITRPNIVFVINIPNQFMHAPRAPHMETANHVLRYIKSCLGPRHFLQLSNSLQVIAYMNSNWASCPTTHCSTIKYFIQLDTNPIFWHTKKQTILVHSSIKVEYHAMAVITYELALTTSC